MNIVITIIILLIYTLIMIKIGGSIPSSLSTSVFNIPTNKRWIWTAVILTVCFFCIPTYIEKTSENTQFLAFLAIAGLAFVGAASLVKFSDDKMQFRVNEVGAIVCAACSQLVIVFNYPWFLLSWIPFIIYGFIKGYKNWRTIVF